VVGPDEYADIWLGTVGRVLVTTNVGTRVNMRVYGSASRVILQGTSKTDLERAKREIAAAFAPFVNTPDGRPRPLTVFVEIPSYLRATTAAHRTLLSELATFVESGQAASGKGAPLEHAPEGQALGLAVRVGWGRSGQAAAMAAIDLAAHAHIATLMIDGVKRKQADQAISYAGLLDYFPPGLIGPLLRRAKEKAIRLRTANLPDTDTIARSVWVGLNTARGFGANLGKYGCFPLTLDETDKVVGQIQTWMADWSAAPVLFVDQGVLGDDEVDVGHDLMRGLKRWLQTVASRGAKVVLIDTIDKAKGGHLLRKDSADKKGFLSLAQIKRVDADAKRLGIKVLWAGGLAARDAYEMGRLGVFGIYVTSAVAKLVPVRGSYVHDAALAALKEPQRDAVLRVKILIEAGFLSSKLSGEEATNLSSTAERLLTIMDEKGEAGRIVECTEALSALCRKGWQAYWSTLP
jgi:hypothetical protein